MRIATPIFAAAIFGAALIISYVHTLELMHAAGLSGVLAHLGVITFEVAFALGTLSLVFESASRHAAIVSIALGLSVVAAANVVSGVAHGIPGVAIGVAIPAAVVTAEVLLKGSLRHGGVPASATHTRVSVERQTVSQPAASGNDTTADTTATASDTPAIPSATASDTPAIPSDTTAVPITTVSERRAIVRQRRDNGVSVHDIAAELSVSARTVHRDLAAG